MSRPWFGRRDAGRRAPGSRAPGRGDPVGGGQGADGRVAAVAGSALAGVTVAAEEPLITIDALGRKCPIPIIWLAEQIRDVPVGAIIAVLADDPAAYSDIPAWCSLKSHDCAFRAELPSGWSFGIRRRY
jgi:tRNA 2-thiouridine synthesizing protein A